MKQLTIVNTATTEYMGSSWTLNLLLDNLFAFWKLEERNKSLLPRRSKHIIQSGDKSVTVIHKYLAFWVTLSPYNSLPQPKAKLSETHSNHKP